MLTPRRLALVAVLLAVVLAASFFILRGSEPSSSAECRAALDRVGRATGRYTSPQRVEEARRACDGQAEK